MKKKVFGTTADGRKGYLFTIGNNRGLEVSVTDYGASIVSIIVLDRNEKPTDVVLGYDSLEEYLRGDSYFGATVGRNCNRIEGAAFSMDGRTYKLEDNNFGNNLHSGSHGVSFRFWNLKACTDNSLTLELEDKDLEQGFPGNAKIEVSFTVTEDNALVIDYRAVADQKTVFNFTNHAYFNLNGEGSGTAMGHLLSLRASHYTPFKGFGGIPTGELAEVAGTAFDFREPKTIGKDLGAGDEQLGFTGGYDHNFVIDKASDGVETAAVVYGQESGIRMTVSTDCPGIQLYSANFPGSKTGKGGKEYHGRDAFCLETQYFPNAVNEPGFATPVTEAGEIYRSRTIYKFDK